MGKIITLTAAFFMAVCSALAADPVGYEWWFDNDLSTVGTGTVTGTKVELSPDVSGLTKGLHHFNLRMHTADSVWGAPYRKMFFTTDSTSVATAYEYWIDDNYDKKVTGDITGGAGAYVVSLEGVRKGLHRFNYRLRNGAGVWGSVYSDYFYYSTAGTPFTVYEYWLDDDYANRKSETTNTNPVNFSIDLTGFDKSSGAHYFNLRVRDDDGEWSSVYRKLIIFYKEGDNVPMIGYRHYLNGDDLGYVEVSDTVSGKRTFSVDLPEGVGFNMADATVKFNGDEVSVASNDSVHYRLQIRTELGWAPPVDYDVEVSSDFSTTAEVMTVPSSILFARPTAAEFKAVKFTTDGRTLYLRTDRRASMDIYRDGIKVISILPEKLVATKRVELEAGTYFGVIYGVEEGDGDVAFHLMDTNPTLLVEYNGRYMTLTAEEEDAEIRYSLDGGDPETVYSGSFDVGGLHTLRAIVLKEGYEDSDVIEYDIPAYGDERHAETTAGGLLAKCYEWADSTLLREMTAFEVKGYLDAGDYAVIRTMRSMRHLNLKEVESEAVPDSAFAGMNLISVSMPAGATQYGSGLFSGNTRLCSVVCNGTAEIAGDFADGVSNPNLLLYVANPAATPLKGVPARNIVAGGAAESITLTDGYPFYALEEFNAGVISYMRNFSRETEIDGCSGWETLTLPFDVETVSDATGAVAPFASEAEDCRKFWLYEPSGTGWERTAGIRANKPYIIAMPNHPYYADESIIKGDVTFSAQNAFVASTPEEEGFSYIDDAEMFGTYQPHAADDSLYVLNEDNYEGFKAGSVFVRGLRDVRPFECYLTSSSQARYMPVFDTSYIDMLMAESGCRIWSEGHDIYIRSGLGMRVRIFDVTGRLLRIVDVKAGETTRVEDFNAGIYIVGHTKIYVKG